MSFLMLSKTSNTMLPRTNPLHRWLAVAVFLVLVYFYHPTFTRSSAPEETTGDHLPVDSSGGAVDELTWVKKLLKDNSIGPDIEYASRTIRYIPDAKRRKSMTEINTNLFPQSFTNITINKYTELPAGRVLDVHIKQSPRPDQVDASRLLFAASTTFKRFSEQETTPVAEWSRWLTDGMGHSNGAGLILALFNATEEQLATARDTLDTIGVNHTVVRSSDELDMAGRYVDLVNMMHNHPTRKRREYFALIDDDTFFPYPDELMNVLSEYNPTRPFYIGTFTERVDWMLGNQAPMAYGGGGIFLTAPVLQRVAEELPCLEKQDNGNYVLDANQGDRLLFNCLHKYTEITLTYLPSLHQEDQFGDPSGFYESGQLPLSLHHFKSWHHIRPAQIHTVADACGETCVLQRFQFTDDYIISNGYSIAHYPGGIDFDPLLMEGTFDDGNKEKEPPEFGEVVFVYSFGMLRKSLNNTGKKKQWELLGSKKEGDGRVKQVYLKRRGDSRWRAEEEKAPARDSVVVLTWIP
jgi:hypothetical protein